MNKICGFFKNHKMAIIIISIVGLIIIGLILYLVISNNDSYNGRPSNVSKADDKLVAPAKSTEDLLEDLTEVKVEEVTSDEVVFAKNVLLEEGEIVAVWVYSEPKFLGYFEIIVEAGIKKIKGLEKALENISVEVGKHNLAIVKESGKEVGYIDVYINHDGLSENEIKEVIENGSVNFITIKQEEVNMKNGTKEVVQAGKKGEKTVAYKVTYDQNGKEQEREKVAEKITKEPIEEIIKVGVSDWNINIDKIMEISFGPACTESELSKDEAGYIECQNANTEYYAVKINTSYYITSFKENGAEKLSSPIKVTGTKDAHLISSVKGTKYYFYMSGGGGMYDPLTKEKCEEYKLSCGAW